MFYSTIFSFCVFSDCDNIYIFIWSLITFHRFTWADIGIQVELSETRKYTGIKIMKHTPQEIHWH